MDNTLHIHNDIEEASLWFKIPLVFCNKENVYIMQEDRCVFVGTPLNAKIFYNLNNGRYCESKFPI